MKNLGIHYPSTSQYHPKIACCQRSSRSARIVSKSSKIAWAHTSAPLSLVQDFSHCQANVHRLPMDLSVHYASHFPEGQGSSAQHKHPSICPISSYRLYKHNFTNQSKSVFESQLSRHVWLQSNSISTLPMILCAFLKIRCPDFAVVGV